MKTWLIIKKKSFNYNSVFIFNSHTCLSSCFYSCKKIWWLKSKLERKCLFGLYIQIKVHHLEDVRTRTQAGMELYPGDYVKAIRGVFSPSVFIRDKGYGFPQKHWIVYHCICQGERKVSRQRGREENRRKRTEKLKWDKRENWEWRGDGGRDGQEEASWHVQRSYELPDSEVLNNPLYWCSIMQMNHFMPVQFA